MTRLDYTESSINNLINANIKLVDENKDIKKELEEKTIYINTIKYKINELKEKGIEEIKLKEIINIINEIDEKDIFSDLL